MSDTSVSNLGQFVAMVVPLRILAIVQEWGEPQPHHWEQAREINDWLGEKCDILLFGSKKKGESASLANALAQAIAVLSFLPGGIEIFGQRFDATKIAGYVADARKARVRGLGTVGDGGAEQVSHG